MPDLKLDILIVPTYSKYTLGVADISVYPDEPPVVSSPTLTIQVPNFGEVVVPFNVQDFNNFNSTNLTITTLLEDNTPLPDGLYEFKYSIAPSLENFVEKSFMRTEAIQEKYDEAFMKLDMMECDMAIKKQQKVTLDTIKYFIQGSISAANNCARIQADKLYREADRMLNNFIKNDCGCSGNNYLTH